MARYVLYPSRIEPPWLPTIPAAPVYTDEMFPALAEHVQPTIPPKELHTSVLTVATEPPWFSHILPSYTGAMFPALAEHIQPTIPPKELQISVIAEGVPMPMIYAIQEVVGEIMAALQIMEQPMLQPVRWHPSMMPYEPIPAHVQTYSKTAAGIYRAAEDALALYELYVGAGVDPDLTASPDATSTTLPFTHALAAAGVGLTIEYRLTALQRNKYGFLSNVNLPAYRTVEINDGGTQVTSPPSAPENIAVTAQAAGAVQAQADYGFYEDGANKANNWRIYAKVGSDPVPGVDAVTATVAMGYLSESAVPLDNTFGSYTTGQVVHVLIRTYRSGDTTESTNTTAIQVTADAAGLSFNGGAVGEGFGGDQFEQAN